MAKGTMLLKVGGLKSQQFASLAAFLESKSNTVISPEDNKLFSIPNGGYCGCYGFARLVKASQRDSGGETDVVLEVITCLLWGPQNGRGEYRNTPRSYLDGLLDSIGIMPRET